METDYKKLYEEALERARDIRSGNPQSDTANFVCKEIFPELAESEDERIKNFLIDFIKVCGWSDKQFPPREDCIAWLEKQGEQKPVGYIHHIDKDGNYTIEPIEKKPSWSEEDERMLGKCIDAASGYYSLNDKEQMKEWLEQLKPQPRWKPTDEQMEDFKLAIAFLEDYGYTTCNIKSLYEQLKKT